MQDFRHLRVWQAAHRSALAVYRLTAAFPRSELFGITSQLRRSAAAIGANIAEGCGRSTDPDARRCFHNALGEACEALNHALLARDLGYLDARGFAEIEDGLQPTRRMLIRLIQSVDRRAEGREPRAHSRERRPPLTTTSPAESAAPP